MAKKDKKQELEEEKEEQKLVIDDVTTLTTKLKEFENKVFLEKLRILENYTGSAQKEIKEIKKIVSYILLQQEELLNLIHNSNEMVVVSKTDSNLTNETSKDRENTNRKDKKWN